MDLCDSKFETNTHDQYCGLPSLKLSVEDYKVVKNGDWLTDNVINSAQDLLKKSHPNIGGLQEITKGEVLSYDIDTGEFAKFYTSHDHIGLRSRLLAADLV